MTTPPDDKPIDDDQMPPEEDIFSPLPDDEDEIDLAELMSGDDDLPELPEELREEPVQQEKAVTPPRRDDIPVGVPVDTDDDLPDKSVKALDVCPNCGSPMPGADALVCLRCGYDLKQMRVIKPELGEIEADEGDRRPMLSKPGMGDLWLPSAVAVFSLVIMIIAYFSGYPGLFPFLEEDIEKIDTWMRLQGVLGYISRQVVWIICGIGVLALIAHTDKKQLGDFLLAVLRMVAVTTTMSLPTLINFTSDSGEMSLEYVVRPIVAVVLLMLFYRLAIRDAAMAAGGAVIGYFVLYFGAVMLTL